MLGRGVAGVEVAELFRDQSSRLLRLGSQEPIRAGSGNDGRGKLPLGSRKTEPALTS